MKLWPLILLPLIALGGCVTTQGGSVVGGECKFIERPSYVVKGARQYDQDWIDSTIEGGVGACGWTRPAPRPAELDAVLVVKAKPVAKSPKKRPTIWQMLHTPNKKKPAPQAAPVAPVTPIADAPPPEPVAAPEPPAAPKECSLIDKLLSPGACP